MQSAPELGVSVEDLLESTGMDLVRYRVGDREALVQDGRIYPGLSVLADGLIADKQASKMLLEGAGIPVTEGIAFRDAEEAIEAIQSFMEGGGKYVCKPLHGTEGEAVGMNLKDPVDVSMYVEDHAEYKAWLLEKQVEGQDLRIQVVGGRIVAACIRKPASVIGDGNHSLEELIELRNEEIRAQNPQNKLDLDPSSRQLLREQALYLSDVPEPGREVQLKYIGNISQGGRAVDCTDQLHPAYAEWVSKAVQAFNLETFSLDAITSDPGADPALHSKVLELNARAQWLHHTFSDGRQHPMPRIVLSWLLNL